MSMSASPSWAKGLAATKQGWNADARHNEALTDLHVKYMARCDRENLTTATKRLYNEKIPKMINFFIERGRTYWQEVTLADVQAWIAFTQTQDVSEHTKQGWVRVSKTFLRWLASEGLDGHLAALPRIKHLQGKQYIPSPLVLTSFMKQFDQETVWGFRDYVVCTTIIGCGARIGEICAMSPTDILWDQGMIRLFGKGRKERFVPVEENQLFPLLKKWLNVREEYADGNGKDRLFINRAGGACQPNTFDQAFRKQRLRTGLGSEAQGSLSPHTLRHFFCTNYLLNGGKIEILQTLVGHSEIETTMGYLHHANRIGTVKDDHTKVAPLGRFFGAADGEKKRRKMK
jgi:site-specific recombinase XerD